MVTFVLILLIFASFTPLFLAMAGRIGWGWGVGLTAPSLVAVCFGWYWAGVYMDSLWFGNLGFGSVFWGMLQYKWAGFGLSFITFFVLASLALWLLERAVIHRASGGAAVKHSVIFAISLGYGLVMYGQWNKAVLFLNGGAFGVADPIFGKDVGFYVFRLPFYNTVATILFTMFIVALALMGVFLLYHNESKSKVDWARTIRSFCIVGAAALGVLIWMRFLANYSFLVSGGGGVVWGVGYTDKFRIVMNDVFIGAIILAILLLLGGAFSGAGRKTGNLAIGAGGLLVGVWLVCLAILPACVQAWSVSPNEFQREQPYIENNIEFTRQAFNLQGAQEGEFTPSPLTPGTAEASKDTLDNIRVWDWRALASSYQQLQSFRLYYGFSDMDIDRYLVGGEYRQVLLSAREFYLDRLTQKTWVNEHLVYTHGYGVVANEVNTVEKGSPVFAVKNIPPTSSVDGITVSNPAIYFGDVTSGYVIANSRTKEFDYPKGDENVYASYNGHGGIKMDTFIRRLAAAIKFNDLGILITSEIKPESQFMWARNIQERVGSLVPYLALDHDNYIVIRADGTLAWMQDTYTISDKYPYSTPWYYMNYIRNSVKAVIDAYNGDVSFYVFDSSDPIINAYRKAFPPLFRDAGDMPSDLASHIRYPEDMLSIQAQVYGTFHMTDPMVFYSKEDVWVFATEVLEQGREQQIIPYYVLIRLPNVGRDEFIQMIPYTPSGKQNAIGWIAGRCDGVEYGNLVVYKFPKQSLVYGTMQFEAVVNQNDEMASQFTLWTKTSSVIRGNTLVIPIGDSLMYVEPIYLQSETAKMPQLVRVIVGGMDGDGNLRVAWDADFSSALSKLLGVQVSPPSPETQPITLTPEAKAQLQDLLNRLEYLKKSPLQDSPKNLDEIIDYLKGLLGQGGR